MREILFRAKTYSDNYWVFGYLIKGNVDNDFYIKENLSEDAYWIDKNTVGQFTGLIDLNGKKIFEGDIIADYFGKIYGVVEYGDGSFDSGILKYTGFYCKSLDKFSDENSLYDESDEDYWDRHQVIGNIHDNPELLKLKEWKKPKEKRNKKCKITK